MGSKKQGKRTEEYFGKVSNLQLFIEKYEKQFELLTGREEEILTLVVNGFKNAAIGKHLDISQEAVQTYRHTIQAKLSIKNEAGYIKFALAFGLIPF